MSKNKSMKSIPGLKISKIGSWNDIVDTTERVSSILKTAEPNDLDEEITESEINKLSDEWDKWRPRNSEEFSREMRIKTAKQSCVKKPSLNRRERKKKLEKAKNQMNKAVECADKKDFEEAKKCFFDSLTCIGKAVNSSVKRKVRAIEESIYKDIILKINPHYFDNNNLSVTLSKRWGASSSERYGLTIHSNKPKLRELFVKKIDFDHH